MVSEAAGGSVAAAHFLIRKRRRLPVCLSLLRVDGKSNRRRGFIWGVHEATVGGVVALVVLVGACLFHCARCGSSGSKKRMDLRFARVFTLCGRADLWSPGQLVCVRFQSASCMFVRQAARSKLLFLSGSFPFRIAGTGFSKKLVALTGELLAWPSACLLFALFA